MTVTGYLLLALGLSMLFMVLAMLIPRPPLNPPHPFETDPFEDDGEHVGRHRSPYPEGPTRRLGDSLIRRSLR